MAYVVMTVHTETLDLIHDLNSIVLARLLIVPQAKPKNSLANSGEEIVVVLEGTLGGQVLVGGMVCHAVCLGESAIGGLSVIAQKFCC